MRLGRLSVTLGAGFLLLVLLQLLDDLRFRRENRTQHVPLHLGSDIDIGDIGQILDDPLDNFAAELLMGHLPAAKLDHRPDFRALEQELAEVLGLELEVMVVDLRPVAHLLKLRRLLLLFVLLLFLRDFVLVLAVIENTADRGTGVGRDFDKVEIEITGTLQRFTGRKNADLASIRTDQADRRNANAVVNSGISVSGD